MFYSYRRETGIGKDTIINIQRFFDYGQGPGIQSLKPQGSFNFLRFLCGFIKPPFAIKITVIYVFTIFVNTI
jgi:hypothetical protein